MIVAKLGESLPALGTDFFRCLTTVADNSSSKVSGPKVSAMKVQFALARPMELNMCITSRRVHMNAGFILIK